MTDFQSVLPHHLIAQHATLIASLERHRITTTDLLILDPAEISKRTHIRTVDVQKLCDAVLHALQADWDTQSTRPLLAKHHDSAQPTPSAADKPPRPSTEHPPPSTISTLDAALDAALGGGIPVGYTTEITGESGAGKTQFLLSLLLAVQLAPPHGLGRPALYISTEAPLSTTRLAQILAENEILSQASQPPTLDSIISTTTPDLESQEHILTYQVPVEVERRNIGLIVLDSVAANYRAEHDRARPMMGAKRGPGAVQGSNLAARGAELVRLGMLLRELARKYNLAVVVANQVADRFAQNSATPFGHLRRPAAAPVPLVPLAHSSPLAARAKVPDTTSERPALAAEPSSSTADLLPTSSVADELELGQDMPPDRQLSPPRYEPYHTHIATSTTSGSTTIPTPLLTLDHQQRFFTGWGDDPFSSQPLKTPSLGLVWSSQIACRIALLKAPYLGPQRMVVQRTTLGGGNGGNSESKRMMGEMPARKSWRRWMKVVFAPHVAPTGQGLDGAVEFDVWAGGLVGVVKGS